MIKFFRISILMAMIAVAITGCGDDEKENQPAIKPQSQEALTQTVFADQTDGKSGVTFVTTGPWTSTIKEGTLKAGTDPWVSIDPASGDKAGTYTITIKLEPNDTGSERSAVITITCNSEEIKITVTQKGTKEDGKPYKPVSGVTLSQTVATLFIGGDPLILTADVLPVDADDKTVEWTSSNPNVATVADGMVTAVAEGTATITATTKGGGKTAVCEVTVIKPTPKQMTIVGCDDFYVYIKLAGSGTAMIDWGDGTAIETHTLSTDLKDFGRDYSTRKKRTVTISGENITHLDCASQNITHLDVNKNSTLQYLNCNFNSLMNIDVSGVTALAELHCNYNQLTSLDLSKTTYTSLIYLNCEGNKLTNLSIGGATALAELLCFGNQLTSLDVSMNSNLRVLNCDDNQLTNLSVGGATVLAELRCDNNQLTSLDVSDNSALRELHCGNNQITSLDLSKTTYTSLIYLNCDNNQLTSLDVRGAVALTGLNCYVNKLTGLDVSKNIAIIKLNCSYNQLTSLDVSKNIALDYLQFESNKLTNFDASKNTVLTYLHCASNLFTDIGLNALFNTLNSNAITGKAKYVYIRGNQGTNSCNRKIATDRGWYVSSY